MWRCGKEGFPPGHPALCSEAAGRWVEACALGPSELLSQLLADCGRGGGGGRAEPFTAAGDSGGAGPGEPGVSRAQEPPGRDRSVSGKGKRVAVLRGVPSCSAVCGMPGDPSL